MLEERLQQLELARGQLDGVAGDACPTRAQVERDFADAQLRLL